MSIHEHYEQLTDKERQFVDEQFRRIFQQGRSEGIPLFGDDHAERAVDAFAKLIIESRGEKPWNYFEPPTLDDDDGPCCENCGRTTADLAEKEFAERACGNMLCDWCYPTHATSCEMCKADDEEQDDEVSA